MKTPTFFLLMLIAVCSGAIAQPQISYIIPDIGTPGMNTYVEIIGPTTGSGNFGADGLYPNNPGDAVRVEPNTTADAAKIVVGPIVVSWSGRMIATQVFVKPGVANGTVQLKVTVGGSSSTVDFEIVSPQNLGAIGNGVLDAGSPTNVITLGSGGTAGTRSKRGAMIVQSLTLRNGTFTVSTTDTDPGTPGNQGFLPFILISKKNIAINFDATLKLDASGLDGAAGGGGGGGKVCDGLSGNSGTAGGKGYTGGGSGGQNNPDILSSDQYNNNPGESSGTSGNGLNGAKGGGGNAPSCGGPEGTGGGTGHPFGKGGDGACEGLVNGQYGGGGSGNQTQAGGGGGYGTAGAAGGIASNPGKSHGNVYGVPVAGGSGGGGGNPQSVTGCAGEGGGAGGAVGLFANDILTNSGSIFARGANATAGTPGGGGGSGGYIGLGAKIQGAFGGTGDSKGGNGTSGGGNGGQGRARYDGFVTTGLTVANSASTYVGPTTDTLSTMWLGERAITGTRNGTDQIRVYIRNDNPNAQWTLLPAPNYNGRLWSITPTLAMLQAGSATGNFYVCAVQGPYTVNADPYSQNPQWVFSQSAADIVNIQLIPKIKTDQQQLAIGLVVCTEVLLDTLVVTNEGDAPLTVTPSIFGPNQTDFTILPPYNAGFTVAPGSSVEMQIRFAPAVYGNKTATLRLANNDPRGGKSPTDIPLSGSRRRIEASLNKTQLDFGRVCFGQWKEDSVEVTFIGDVNDQIVGIPAVLGAPNRFSVTAPDATSLDLNAPTDKKWVRIRFQPDAAGTFNDSVRISVGQCTIPLLVKLRGEGVDTRLEFQPPLDTLRFREVLNTTSLPQNITIRGRGTSRGTITKVYLDPPNNDFSIPTTLAGTSLDPLQTNGGNVTFRPTTIAGYPYVGNLCIIFGTECPDTICVPVIGEVINAKLLLSRDQFLIASDTCQDPPLPVTDTFKLSNPGTIPVKILNVTTQSGVITVTPQAANGGTDLLPGDSITFTVTWQPGTSGTDVVIIRTDATDPSQQTLRIGVALQRLSSRIALRDKQGGAAPTLLDFGAAFKCTIPKLDTIRIANTGDFDETIRARFADGRYFTLGTTPPISVAKGTERLVPIAFNTAAAGVHTDTLILTDDRCKREFRVAIRGELVDLQYDVTGITFGQTNVGFSSGGYVRFTNSSSVPVTVSQAMIRPAAGSGFATGKTNAPITLGPGLSISDSVIFTPLSEQPYAADYCFIVTSPCLDTVCVPITGQGIQSAVRVTPNPLDFGINIPCDDDTLTLTVENIGTADFGLNGVTLTNNTENVFEQLTQTWNQTVKPGQKVEIQYRFARGRAATPGVKQGTITIYTNDAKQPVIQVAVQGEVGPALVAVPDPYDFGIADVAVGAFVDGNVTVQNRSNSDITVAGIVAPPPFQVSGFVPPQTLKPGETLMVAVRFAPTDTGTFQLPLWLIQNAPCNDTSIGMLRGIGERIPQGIATITIPDTVRGTPGDRVGIPILLSSGSDLSASGATTLQATVRFNGSMLYPVAARSKGESVASGKAVTGEATTIGRIITNTLSGSDRVVTFSLANNPMPTTAPDTLGFLDVVVALGNATVTPITFDTLFFSDGKATATGRNGAFLLDGYCAVGGNRIVKVSGAFGIKMAAPNPFNPSTDIHFETVEDGATSLEIFDLYGRRVAALLDREQLPTQPHVATWDAGRQPSGIYYAVLTTPTQRSILRLMLLR